jgi:hypothetical protein
MHTGVLKFFNVLIFRILTVLLYIYSMLYVANYVIFFVECSPDDGRGRPKHVGSLPHVLYYCV